MDRKIWTILLSIILIGCFFVPLFNETKVSWYDLVFKTTGGDWKKYIPLLIPLSAVLLLIGALNNGSYFLGRGLWTSLPLLTMIYFIIGEPLIDGVDIGDIFKHIGEGYGIGMWVTIGASVLLAFVHPRPR